MRSCERRCGVLDELQSCGWTCKGQRAHLGRSTTCASRSLCVLCCRFPRKRCAVFAASFACPSTSLLTLCGSHNAVKTPLPSLSLAGQTLVRVCMPKDKREPSWSRKECDSSPWCRPSTADRNSGRQRKLRRAETQFDAVDVATPPPTLPLKNLWGAPVKKGPPEGHFTALPEVEAAEVCEQLRDVWRQRNLTFEDCWSDQRESFEEVDVKEVSGQVEQGIEGQERVKLEDLQGRSFCGRDKARRPS